LIKYDKLVKSRHSRLSGIVVPYNVLKRNDSGQAGMTSKEGFSTFYETAKYVCVAFLCLAFAPVAQAGIFYDVELKGTYEDNAVNLLSDERGNATNMPAGAGGGMMGTGDGNGNMMQPADAGPAAQAGGDYSMSLFADLGGFTMLAEGAALFLTGSAQRTEYRANTQFDSTIAGLGAGVIKELGDIFTARLSVNGSVKRYNDASRNGSAYGAALTFKEQLSSAFWLKETYDYERNNADSVFFDYKGSSFNIRAGYSALPYTTVLLGYGLLVRDYDGPSDFRVTANTGTLGLEYEFARKWFASAQYDRQTIDATDFGSSVTDNIFSLGVRYSH